MMHDGLTLLRKANQATMVCHAYVVFHIIRGRDDDEKINPVFYFFISQTIIVCPSYVVPSG